MPMGLKPWNANDNDIKMFRAAGDAPPWIAMNDAQVERRPGANDSFGRKTPCSRPEFTPKLDPEQRSHGQMPAKCVAAMKSSPPPFRQTKITFMGTFQYIKRYIANHKDMAARKNRRQIYQHSEKRR
jgi:hypothetical protein